MERHEDKATGQNLYAKILASAAEYKDGDELLGISPGSSYPES